MIKTACGLTFFLYGLVTAAIPLLIRDFGGGAPQYLVNCLLVLGLCLILLPLFLALVLGFERLGSVCRKMKIITEDLPENRANVRTRHEAEDIDN